MVKPIMVANNGHNKPVFPPNMTSSTIFLQDKDLPYLERILLVPTANPYIT
ncbi:hypothetical protein [Neobacillus vireti]|uniref:hypothetical protein n=1 Tax=Neobacillus vireti TaxID=220686 RepID=UPI002FFEB3A0